MITSLTLHNFKAWRNIDMDLGKVTGIFGANSSGKSSLLQFLLMLKQTKNATDRGLVIDFGDANNLVNLGTFGDVVHHHDGDASIQWSLGWTLQRRLHTGGPQESRKQIGAEGDRVHLECSIGLRGSELVAQWLRYRIGDYAFALEPSQDRPTEFRLESENDKYQFVRNRGRAWPLPGPVKSHLFPDQVKFFFQNTSFLAEFEYGYEELMDNTFSLGPLREYPRRQYGWAGARPYDVGQRGERAIDAILAATARGETQNIEPRQWHMPFQSVIAYWLKHLGLIESFSIREIAPGANLYQAWVKRDQSSDDVLLTDVGFGVSQVLPVVVLLAYVPEGSTVLLEQPEIHLHPSVQSGLADYILWAARKRSVQVIVESHSEHLLRRLQRRVAEESASAQEVKLYFTSMDGSEAKLRDLELNQWGEIQNWPDNFFGDEMGELSAIAINSLRRKSGGNDGR